MRKFDGVIFDVDGTLTSTNELIFATFNHVAEKYLGRTFTDTEITSMFGPTEDVILKQLMNENFEVARKDYLEFYSTMHHAMADIYPGLKEVIDLIKSRKIPISIYTGKGRDSTEITLKKIGVYELFDLVVSGDDIEGHKPSPEGIDLFIEKFELDRSRILMVGDAPADVIAARNANIKIASVLWDSYAKEKVLKMDSDYFFETVDEFKKFLEKSL